MERFNWVIAAVLLSTFTFGAAMAAEQAGVTAAVRGEVNLDPVTGQTAHAATSGEDVFLGDGISSGDQSGLQLMLLDETIFTVGANTDLTVDDFVYDPATGAGRMSASLTKGIFRFVAGNIAQGDPDDMVINLPTGTIGIRGTVGIVAIRQKVESENAGSQLDDFFGGTSDLPPATGDQIAQDLLGTQLLNADFEPARSDFILAILLETKNEEDPDQKGMVVSNAGASVELTVPGWGSILVPGQPPSPPFFAPDFIDMGGLLGNFSAGPTDTLVERTDTNVAPDSVGGVGIEIVSLSLTSVEPINALGSCCELPVDPILPPDTGFNPCDALTCFEDLPLAGTALYNGSGTFTQTQKLGNPANIQGTFSATLDIDFANRQFCFGGCSISVNTLSFGGNINPSSNGLTGVNTIDFANEVGFAGGVLDSNDLTNPNFAGTTVGLVNTGGIVANQGSIKIFYDDGSGNQGSGSGLSDPASFSP